MEDEKIINAVDGVDGFVMTMKKGNPEVGGSVIDRILQMTLMMTRI